MTNARRELLVRVPARFHAPNSVLGLLSGHGTTSRFARENAYLFAVTVVWIGMIGVTFAISSVAPHFFGGGPGRTAWIVTGIVAFLVTAVGVRRPITIRIGEAGIAVRQGARTRRLSLDRILSLSVLEPTSFHRRELRARDVAIFVNDYRHMLLRMETPDEVVVLGIPEASADDVVRALQQRAIAPKQFAGA